MKNFIKKVGKILLIGAAACMVTFGRTYAMDDITYIEGMYREGLDREMYSETWYRTEIETGYRTYGRFRGQFIDVTLDYSGCVTYKCTDEYVRNIVCDYMKGGNLEKYHLSDDEKAYLTISLYLATMY